MTDPAPHCYAEPTGPGPVGPGPAGPGDPENAGPFAECVLCGEPTEHPASLPGTPLCPVCAWQQAQRSACSG